jgi:DNA-binding winged helix-turn-helix (wHTH) protein/TolB-like protein
MNADETLIPIDLAREARFTLGGAEVRPATRELVADGRREVLEPRIMQVLVALARRRGEVVSRDELIAVCWGGRVVGEDSIHRCIAAIRRLAETWGGFSVETVARVGYRLAEAKGSGAGLVRTSRFPAWAWTAGPIAVAVVFIAVATGWFALDHRPPPAPIRIAVLPFDAVGGQDASNLAETLLDEIVGALSANQVEAVSRTESAALRGPSEQADIAQLGVGLLLDGAVQSDGKTFTVHAHLDDARRHVTLWSETLTAPVQDAMSFQTQVAGLLTHITKWAVSPAVDGVRDQPDILAAFLQNQEVIDVDPGGLERALARGRVLVATAPNFAAGHAQLANLIALAGLVNQPVDAHGEPSVEATKEARLALAIDPTNSLADDMLGVLSPPTAWRQREEFELKALANAATGDYEPHDWYGQFLTLVGRNREAVTQARLSVAADPLSPQARWWLVTALMDAGEPEEANAIATDALGQWPHNGYILVANLEAVTWTPRPSARAVALLDTLGELPGEHAEVIAAKAEFSDDAVQKRNAIGLLTAELENGATATIVDTQGREQTIVALAQLGDADTAFREAERVYPLAYLRPTNPWATWQTALLFTPKATALRRDPRFMSLANRLGLVDYWRTSGHWPDFCSEPSLPYNCKAEAARLAAAKPTS